MTIVCLLWLASFIGWLLCALGKCPAWVAGLLSSIAGLMTCWPAR